MTILAKIGFAGKNRFLPAKNIFASPVFSAEKNRFFPLSGKNLPTLITRCHAVAGRTARCRYKFRHNGIVHAVTLLQHGFLVLAYISNRSNAENAPHSTLIFTAVTQNHTDSRRSWHTTNITRKTHGDREYMIILQR